MLRDRLDRAIVERSRSAIEGACDLAKVFVPTRAYYSALDSVGKKSFVVLSGAPEAGKTAIGRMVCLAQHARGWEVVECRDPEDVLKRYEAHHPQCFFADDFFGRTEFDTTRASRWEADLPAVLKRMNEHHWLVLTSRAHILHFGERAVDVDTDVHFPQESEVIVDASNLMREERARILYRHAKTCELLASTKNLIRYAAWNITGLASFTPERARRLVQEWRIKEPKTFGDALKESENSFLNPSDKSIKTFQKLPESHKWFLFSLLEEPDYERYDNNSRYDTYVQLCPHEFCGNPDRIEADLLDAFLSTMTKKWAHPSYRDVAIDELTDKPIYRSHFLTHCHLPGMKIALSFMGGASGSRRLPLLKTSHDWDKFSARAKELAESGVDILSVLVEARKFGIEKEVIFPQDEANIKYIIDQVRCISTAHNGNENSLVALQTFLDFNDNTGIPVNWGKKLEEWVQQARTHLLENYVPWQMLPGVYKLEKLMDLASNHGVNLEPVLQSSAMLRGFFCDFHKKLNDCSSDWDGYSWDSEDDAREAASDYGRQVDIIKSIGRLATEIGLDDLGSEILGFSSEFKNAEITLAEFAEDLPGKSEKDDLEYEDYKGVDSPFEQDDVEDLFSDL